MERHTLCRSALDKKTQYSFLPPERARDRYYELYPSRSYRRPADATIDAITDAWYGCNCYEALRAFASSSPATYYYRFDYDDSRVPHMLGAAHGMEVPFIFSTLGGGILSFVYNRRQIKRAEPLVDMMMKYWTNFAKSSDPNGPGLLEWPAYTSDEKQRIYLDLPARTAPADNVEKCGFWKEQGFAE